MNSGHHQYLLLYTVSATINTSSTVVDISTTSIVLVVYAVDTTTVR